MPLEADDRKMQRLRCSSFEQHVHTPWPATERSGHPTGDFRCPANIYDYTIPALLRGLGVLQSYLDKMQAAVDAGQFTGEELLQARLADDMLPLGRQFQIACDNAKNGPARLTGQEAPWFADNEQTIGEYRHRVEKTIAYLRTLTPETFEGSQARMIDQSYRRVGSAMAGEDYLRALLLPNFYFHIAVAHSILRHKGIAAGQERLSRRTAYPAPKAHGFVQWMALRSDS